MDLQHLARRTAGPDGGLIANAHNVRTSRRHTHSVLIATLVTG
jgi:hypothetical protein